ncbi:MAG TPA: FKBP-type peptidyl-prolyl cis-trans isomerase [Kofleriaceae bacterium]
MRTQSIGVLLSSLLLAASACNDDANDEPAKPTETRPVVEQVAPPLDLKEPPEDATKTASGLIYKKLVARETGETAKRSDTVMVRYTGWRQRTGQTFFTMNRSGEAMGIDVAYAAPGFGEALQELRKGEKAVLWVPPGQGSPETLVYEVEVVDIKSPTAVASRTADKSKPATGGQETTDAQAALNAQPQPRPNAQSLPLTNAQKPNTSTVPTAGTTQPSMDAQKPKPSTVPKPETNAQPATNAQKPKTNVAQPVTSARPQR